MRRGSRTGTWLLLFLASTFLFAQKPSFRESVTVRLLEIDVRVVDREGNPVYGLTVDDFELRENGAPKEITNFSEIRETSVELTSQEEAPLPEGTLPQASVPRTVVFFIDSLPIRGPARTKIFEQLRDLIPRLIREGDRAMVYVWAVGGAKPVVSLTSEHEALANALSVLERGGSLPSDGVSIGEQAAWFNEVAAAADAAGRGESLDAQAALETSIRNTREEALARMRRKMASLERIIGSLTSSEGKKIVIYVSNEFSLYAGEGQALGRRATAAQAAQVSQRSQYSTLPMIEKLVSAANANGVTFYAIRPEIPETSGQFGSLSEEWAIAPQTDPGSVALRDNLVLQNELAGLEKVTGPTGGAVAYGPAGVEKILERVERDLAAWYTLGWRGESDGSDRERKIVVRAKNPDYRVFARSSLVEKSDRTRARDNLLARLFEEGPSGDLEFEIEKGAMRSQRRARSILPVTLQIPLAQLSIGVEKGSRIARFTVMTAAAADLGRMSDITEQTREVVIRDEQATVEAHVSYSLELLVDENTRRITIGLLDDLSGSSGSRTIEIQEGDVRILEAVKDPRGADAQWALARAKALAGEPLLVYFRPRHCRVGLSARDLCVELERDVLPHPVVTRRLASIAFVTLPATEGEAGKMWGAKGPGLAYVDPRGVIRARWTGVPDAATFGAIVDGVAAAAPHFLRGAALEKQGREAEGELEVALGLAKLGRRDEAREALGRASRSEQSAVKEMAAVIGAILDAAEGRVDQAMRRLQTLAGETENRAVAAEAWAAIGTIHRNRGDEARAGEAFAKVATLAVPGTEVSQFAAAASERSARADVRPFRIVPLEPSVSGRTEIRTAVSSISVARVAFFLNGQPTGEAVAPPFTALVDLGRLPSRHSFRAVAFDVDGTEIASDEISINDAEDGFWARLVRPESPVAQGEVDLEAAVGLPRDVRRASVRFEWNDRTIATLDQEPWRATASVPGGEVGILRVVAQLEDGRMVEDAVLLNAPGYSERAEVQYFEIPLSIRDSRGQPVEVEASELRVKGDRTRPELEALIGADESPLTVGIVLDSSSSVQPVLADLQEAAIQFLGSVLREGDRAFLVTFDSEARLVQGPTSNRELLEKQVLAIQPSGLTALHDAVILGTLQFQGVRGRRALVVFSDGLDRGSRYRVVDAAELARRGGVPVYVIAAMPEVRYARSAPSLNIASPRRGAAPQVIRHPNHSDPLTAWRGELGLITRLTGGELHMLEALEDLTAVYDSIAVTLAAQQLALLRVDPAVRANEWRPIEISASQRGVSVMAPEGYYAPR